LEDRCVCVCVVGGLQVESPVATGGRMIDGRNVTLTFTKVSNVAKWASQLQVDGSCSNLVVVLTRFGVSSLHFGGQFSDAMWRMIDENKR
jgi:hypothetical protein